MSSKIKPIINKADYNRRLEKLSRRFESEKKKLQLQLDDLQLRCTHPKMPPMKEEACPMGAYSWQTCPDCGHTNVE